MAIEALIFLGFFMFLILFFIAMFAFWIWMIIDCAKRDFKKTGFRIYRNNGKKWGHYTFSR